MKFPASSLVALVALASSAVASPLRSRASVTPYSAAQISAFTPYSYFAATAYCNPSTTLNWSCGGNCNANSGFIPTASGGDGNSVQFWYVGYDPALNTVVVAHQGTDTSKILPVLTDGEIAFKKLDATMFPGISSSIEVHDGFGDAQAKAAAAVLAAVKKTMSAHSTKSITAIGHSLGAAISLIDAVYLQLQIPGSTVAYYGYGLPRVGNQDFANYVDASGIKFIRITNKKDIVPIVPGRFLGYHHPSNEAHIEADNSWDSCPGQDNTSDQCSVGAVPNIFDGASGDHAGPYNGVHMGC